MCNSVAFGQHTHPTPFGWGLDATTNNKVGGGGALVLLLSFPNLAGTHALTVGRPAAAVVAASLGGPGCCSPCPVAEGGRCAVRVASSVSTPAARPAASGTRRSLGAGSRARCLAFVAARKRRPGFE